MKRVAVIPAYNESSHIQQVLPQVLQYVDEIIVVDDGSRDQTYRLVQQLAKTESRIIALQHRINLGKGAALKTACDAAVIRGATIIIALDADGQHNPAHIPALIEPITQHQADMVFGSRNFNANMPHTMLFGNKLLSNIINALFHIKVRDTQSGFRAFTPAAYEAIKWDTAGYAVETEMIVRASDAKLQHQEITIDTIYHDNYKGTTAIDGLKILLQIVKWKLI